MVTPICKWDKTPLPLQIILSFINSISNFDEPISTFFILIFLLHNNFEPVLLSTSLDQMFAWKLMADYAGNFWLALKANLGGKPSSSPKSATHRITLFICLLGGSVIWMAYRASFTSELSVIHLKLPFNDLESLYQSNFE